MRGSIAQKKLSDEHPTSETVEHERWIGGNTYLGTVSEHQGHSSLVSRMFKSVFTNLFLFVFFRQNAPADAPSLTH